VVSEKAIQRVFTDIAYLYGRLWYHTYDSRRSASGFPDLVVVLPRVVVYAEIKTAKGRVTETQVEWLKALGQAGSLVAVLRPGCEDQWVHLMADSRVTGRRLNFDDGAVLMEGIG